MADKPSLRKQPKKSRLKHAFTLGYQEMKLQQQLRVMLRDQFGYKDACNSKDELTDRGMKELLDSGIILDKNGERIEGRNGLTLGKKSVPESRRALGTRLYEKLKNGDPIYIFKNGESVPYEVRYDPKSGTLTANAKNIDEMERMPRPDKPSLKDRILNWFLKAYDIELDSCKLWRQYQEQQSALSNAKTPYRAERAKAYSEKLKDRAERKAEREKNKNAEKEAEPDFLNDKGGKEVEKNDLKVEQPVEQVTDQPKDDAAKKEKTDELNIGENQKTASTQPKTAENLQNDNGDKTVEKNDPKAANATETEKNAAQSKKPEDAPQSKQTEKAPKVEQKPSVKPKTKAETMIEQIEKLENGKLSKRAKNNLKQIVENGEKAQQELKSQVKQNGKAISGEMVSDMLILKSVEQQIADRKFSEAVRSLIDDPQGIKILREAAKLSEGNQKLIEAKDNLKAVQKAFATPEATKERVGDFLQGINAMAKELDDAGMIQQTEAKQVQPAPIEEKPKAETMIEQIEKLEGRKMSKRAKENLQKIVLNGEKAQQDLQYQVQNNGKTISGEKVSDMLILKSFEKQITDGNVNEGVMALLDSEQGVEALREATKLSGINKGLIEQNNNVKRVSMTMNNPESMKNRVDEFHAGVDAFVKSLEAKGMIQKEMDAQQKEHIKLKEKKKTAQTAEKKDPAKQKKQNPVQKNGKNKQKKNPEKQFNMAP